MSWKLTSDVWYHFTKIDARKAVCVYCDALLSVAGGSLGNLRRHLRIKHPTVKIERKKSQDSPVQLSSPSLGMPTTISRSRSPLSITSTPTTTSVVNIATPSSTSTVGQKSEELEQRKICPTTLPKLLIANFVEVKKPLQIQKSKEIDLQLLRMICKEYHPFSLVEGEEFIKFVSLLCPNYKLPSRKTLTKSLLPQLYSDLVSEVKSKLENSLAVALTADSWTSLENQSFVAITAHYINTDAILCSNFLCCIELSEGHTSDDLASMLRSQCEEWGISSKLVAIVSDNNANMVEAANQVSKHITCYAHILNSIVNTSIKPIDTIIEKCKILVQYFKRSSEALEHLKEQMQLPDYKLIKYVPTRWNSTYEMLRRLFINKQAIIDTVVHLRFEEGTIAKHDWNVIEHTINVLEIFNDVTKELSDEKSVTISKAIVLFTNLSDFVKEQMNVNNLPSEIHEMCEILLKELSDKIILKENDVLLQASVLDPRFKKSAIKNKNIFETVKKDLILNIQTQIEMEMGENESKSCDQPQIALLLGTSKIWEKFDINTYGLIAKQNPKELSATEMDKYLLESQLPRLFDPLKWWNERKLLYPHVHKLAMSKLCIPVSSLPCERIFSKAGQILTEKRNRLTTNKLSQILFVQFNA